MVDPGPIGHAGERPSGAGDAGSAVDGDAIRPARMVGVRCHRGAAAATWRLRVALAVRAAMGDCAHGESRCRHRSLGMNVTSAPAVGRPRVRFAMMSYRAYGRDCGRWHRDGYGGRSTTACEGP
ncbi:hypothetical protein Asera_41850 [Actinocatenispora sera]|uniref:Uncharacterized protein n=1 Tax=Actinocatenispora sera TaxID=390989 RepID=A0A810L4C4_9ACTN|nr:hypothetical protein Asera_41850 [Actinocatenispora sera]